MANETNSAFPAPHAPNVTADPVEGEETVTLNIDGEDVTVRAGTNVLEAAKLIDKDICHFCYHPGLSIAASCRQCLVQIEKMGKLQPSCQVEVREGMVVHTNSAEVLKARQEMLEFTLKNHRQTDFSRFQAAVAKIDACVECHLVSGGYDYLLKFVTAGITEYQTIMEGRIDGEIGIDKYFSFVVIKSPFTKPHLPLTTLFDPRVPA